MRGRHTGSPDFAHLTLSNISSVTINADPPPLPATIPVEPHFQRLPSLIIPAPPLSFLPQAQSITLQRSTQPQSLLTEWRGGDTVLGRGSLHANVSTSSLVGLYDRTRADGGKIKSDYPEDVYPRPYCYNLTVSATQLLPSSALQWVAVCSVLIGLLSKETEKDKCSEKVLHLCCDLSFKVQRCLQFALC